MRRAAGVWLWALAWVGAVGAVGADAQQRLVREFGGESGLLPPAVALAQDSAGFLWAGTRAGLFRYEGNRFRRWAPEALPRAVGSLAVSPAGRLTVVDAEGRILELTRDGAAELPGTARRSPEHSHVAAFDTGGRLWVITLGADLAWRDGAGRWHVQGPQLLPGDTARRLFSGGSAGGVLVAGSEGLWHVQAGAAARRLLDEYRIVDALTSSDGVIFALSVSGDVVRVDATGRRDVLLRADALPRTRAISVAERNGTFWIATDRYLIAIGDGGVPELLGPDHGVAAGGPVFVDHEGSLWHAGFTVMAQYPEPATRVWNDRHGLSSPHTRYLARSGDVIWVTTWGGAGFLSTQGGGWTAGNAGWQARGQLCPDGTGGLFVGSAEGVRRLRGRQVMPIAADHGTDDNASFGACSPAADGGLWLGSAAGLYHLSQGGTALTRVESFPDQPGNSEVQVVLEDSAGRLWAGSYERICQAPAGAVLSGTPVWTCQQLPPGIVHLNDLAELPGGALWAASHTLGVLRYSSGRWEAMQDNERLPTRSVLALTPSPRGGVWLVGTGILQRVAERADGSGWTVLERLGRWQGLPSVGGGHLLEEADGTVWIATAMGVVQVPAQVRSTAPAPPRMALVEARVDGERVPLDGDLVLPSDRNRLELRFAALTFRDPTRVRFQVRLSPGGAWADTDGQPSFQWVDLPPGRHRPQVRASLDGINWSTQPAEFGFRVLPAWYRTTWAMAGFALAIAALLFGAYRARLAYLLGLERQRTRIAMDLHDEMGSGLASIGILAGVLADNGADHGGGTRIANEVAATAEELGTALSDIVWSLDPHRATLEDLAARLAEHGGRLFADDVEFDTDFPESWPAAPLRLPVLRSVLLIGLEALHNAARHARADRVLLSLRQGEGGWILAVEDDGTGLTQDDGGARGRGRRGMCRRADEIGATIRWRSAPGAGTRVELRFGLSSRRRRFARWLDGGRRGRHDTVVIGEPHEYAGAPTQPTQHR